MRTTVDIPESLLRQARARAALEGTRMMDIVNQALSAYLEAGGGAGSGEAILPRRVKLQQVGRFSLPVVQSGGSRKSQSSPSELKDLEAEEDQKRHAKIFGC